MGHSDDVSQAQPKVALPNSGDLQHEIQVLKAQLRTAEAMFTKSPQGAFVLAPSGRILAANRQAGLLLGVPVQTVTGRRLGHFLTPASQASLTALLQRVFATAERVEDDLVLLSPAERPLSVMVAAQRIDEADEAAGCQLVVTNVTTLKQAQVFLLDEVEALRHAVQEHEQRNRRLDEEVHQVVSATEAQLYLHLGRLQSYLNLHRKDVGLDGRVSSHLDTTQDVLDTTFVLLESLGRYLQARQLRLRSTSVDLNRVLAEARKALHGVLAGREVQWSSASLPTVQGDSKALQMIVQEYLANALKFTRTRERACIHVLVETTAEEYHIGIQDNGVGFNMRHKDKAFELFGRLHPCGSYEGTGLGLAVVRRLAERSGGRAWGDSKVDQGATFWLA
ncbi:sensor histidine kinase [Deinococcus humi]|uniref:histidine kinase n=1 Tax=Deinococcus humi TaxID=662880 RepID=A0A7W8JUT3_9DEIO|nr:ATP-binding protein [Deinococcus humi]MBB5363605.1 signal transduction histidine kinase [Deinococcus humi]GGO30067.1 hypothetical protein GCM10008949_24430 [Deinococcus humi]